MLFAVVVCLDGGRSCVYFLTACDVTDQVTLNLHKMGPRVNISLSDLFFWPREDRLKTSVKLTQINGE